MISFSLIDGFPSSHIPNDGPIRIDGTKMGWKILRPQALY